VRRLAAIACSLAAGAALLVASAAPGGDGGPYEVRAIFDNGAFLVSGEDVRIAGVKVGEIVEVSVTHEDDIATLDGGPAPIPGKAVVVMRIDDPAFQDFRQDASCLARPQSLLGERYVECRHTRARAAGTQAPPPLEEIPEGEPGEGQVLLPLENNGKTVDLDLVQNISRRPYAERLRLIVNDLGAGLAARGDELAEIIERANPALGETEDVLGMLARQNRALAELARDSDTVLAALAGERESVTGFIANANESAQAAAERRADLEAPLPRLPAALRELRPTMGELDAFATQGTPVVSDLGAAAPALTTATEALGPFSTAANDALTSLGKAAEKAGPKLAESDPVIVDVRDLARAAKGGAKSLAALLGSLRETDGFERILELVLNTTGAVNGYDQFGHYLRALLLVTNCVDYQTAPTTGCVANWGAEAGAEGSAAKFTTPEEASGDDDPPGEQPAPGQALPVPGESLPVPGEAPPLPGGAPPVPDDALPDPDAETTPLPESQPPAEQRRSTWAARALLRFLLKDGP
jgi:phospholipid/cholesterol/gamma-HCH transport system substrate-binding protein